MGRASTARMFCYTLGLVLILSATSSSADGCSAALGMESGAIRNAQITSERWLYSDAERNRHFRPHYARLNFAQRGGGWCSDDVDKYPTQHLDIDLMADTKLTAIAIQGKAATVGEYADSFQLSYRRTNDTEYRKREQGGKWKVFAANNDTKTTVRIEFASPIIARTVRLFPQTAQFLVFCVRLELYGCAWTNQQVGLMSYSAEGIAGRGTSNDDSYDGTRSTQTGLLSGGLGRLTDGVIATSSLPSAQWVTFSAQTPVLTFRFSNAQKFAEMTVYVLLKDAVKPFTSMTVFASLDSVKFSVVKFYELDLSTVSGTEVLAVRLPLDNKVARMLRCQFGKARQMTITEVAFSTDLSGQPTSSSIATVQPTTAQGVRTMERSTETASHSSTTAERPATQPPFFTLPPVTSSTKGNKEGVVMPGPSDSSDGQGLSFPIILTIVLGAVVVMAIIGIFVVQRCRKRIRDKGKSAHFKTKPTNGAASELLYEEKISLQGSSMVRYYPTAATNGRQPYRTT